MALATIIDKIGVPFEAAQGRAGCGGGGDDSGGGGEDGAARWDEGLPSSTASFVRFAAPWVVAEDAESMAMAASTDDEGAGAGAEPTKGIDDGIALSMGEGQAGTRKEARRKKGAAFVCSPRLAAQVPSNTTPDAALELLGLLLQYSPRARPSARRALEHPFFAQMPDDDDATGSQSRESTAQQHDTRIKQCSGIEKFFLSLDNGTAIETAEKKPKVLVRSPSSQPSKMRLIRQQIWREVDGPM